MTLLFRCCASALLLSALTPCQDMIGITWSGTVVGLDSFTGTSTTIGSGTFGQNAMAVDDQGTIWSTGRVGTSTYELTTIDPATGAATVVFPSMDTRGLTWSTPGELVGIEQIPGADVLVRIDLGTGTRTQVGPLGYNGVQSLANVDGTLYAWDISQGLLQVDASTGLATPVGAPMGNAPNLQWLARRADGRLVGGENDLYEIDTQTGVATVIATGIVSLRGAEPYQDFVTNFGSGCAGAAGIVTSSATLTAAPNQQLLLQSTNHQPNAAGLVVFGLTAADWNGIPLPVSVDGIFGTSGCSLYVRPDVSVFELTTASSPATLDFTLPVVPAYRGGQLVVQHVVLENVPGGVSFSDAAVVQFGR